MIAINGSNKLCRDPHQMIILLYAAFQKIGNAKVMGNRVDVPLLLPKAECFCSGGNLQPVDSGQIIEDAVAQAL